VCENFAAAFDSFAAAAARISIMDPLNDQIPYILPVLVSHFFMNRAIAYDDDFSFKNGKIDLDSVRFTGSIETAGIKLQESCLPDPRIHLLC